MPKEPEQSDFDNEVVTATSSRPDLPAQEAIPVEIADTLTVPVHVDGPAGLIHEARGKVIAVSGGLGDLAQIFSAELTSERLIVQYETMLRALQDCGFLDSGATAKSGEVHPPTFEDVMGSLSKDDLKFASTFKKPVLLLIPNTAFNFNVNAIRQAIAAGKAGDIQDIRVHQSLFKAGRSHHKITRWDISVVEGSSEIQSDSDQNESLERRLANRLRGHNPLDRGMSLKKYLMLLIATAKDGGIDKEGTTLIEKGRAIKPGEVILASRYSDIINLSLVKPGEEIIQRPFTNSHFRSSVDGEPAPKEK